MRTAARFLLLVLAACLVAGCGSASGEDEVVATPTRPDTARERDEAERSPADEPAVEPVEEPAADETEPAGGESEPIEQPSASSADLLSSAARRDFASLEAQHGELGVAVMPVGIDRAPETVGTLQTAVAWSTIKVPISAAVLERGATSGDRRDITAALAVSDNAAAARLWQRLGDGATAAAAAQQVLRQAGDPHTRVESRTLRPGYSPFGQTSWALADQARFMAELHCLDGADELLRTMRQVTPSQRWGLGGIGTSPAIKGGWGPGSRPGVAGGWLDRQMGIVTIDGRDVAVAIAVRPARGGHEEGIAALDAAAGWLERSVDTAALGSLTANCRTSPG